jgi:phosphomannomutase
MNTKSINVDALMANSGVQFGTSGVRGLVKSMTEEVCYVYTAAFLQEVVTKSFLVNQPATIDHIRTDNKTNSNSKSDADYFEVILGHDLRPSSPHIASICAAAITNAGGQVVYAGALPTPALACYAQSQNASAIVVTGSHIPFDRNGIKFYGVYGEISKADELTIQQTIINLPESLMIKPLPPADMHVEAHYIKRYVDFFGDANFKGLRVAIYEHSGVARDLLRTILEALGVEVITLGRTNEFVPIDTEAVRPEDVIQAAKWAKEYAFDAIFSTDGDADRPLIGDELGQWLRGDMVGILCAKYLAADVVVTPVSSSSLTEKSAWFSQTIRTKIGSPYVIAEMDAHMQGTALVVGFEANGGFLLGSDVMRDGKKLAALATRDAVLPMLAILAMARAQGCKLSELVASLPSRYTYSDRLQNFSKEQSLKLLTLLQHDAERTRLTMAPNAGRIVSIDMTDGFRVSFSSGDIVHLRPSGNAPELRCYAEADTQEDAQSLCDHCLKRVVTMLD